MKVDSGSNPQAMMSFAFSNASRWHCRQSDDPKNCQEKRRNMVKTIVRRSQSGEVWAGIILRAGKGRFPEQKG